VELAFRRFDDPGKDFGEIGEHVTGELLQATFFIPLAKLTFSIPETAFSNRT
jgi:hypothetical protein